MISEINDAIASLSRRLFDPRINHCRLKAAAPNRTVCKLSGTVLDQSTLSILLERLQPLFPQLEFDAAGVRVLRGTAEPRMTVLTNLAGLHREPRRTSELSSELLAGTSVESLQSDGDWIYVRQEDGYLGWVYGAYLGSGSAREPTHLVSAPVGLLRAQPAAAAPPAGRVLAGTAVTPECDDENEWCFLSLPDGREGWIQRASLRARDALAASATQQREQLVADARQLVGVPYRWGGCSALGIDCSGLSQLLHRLVGIALPRDADMQYAAGRSVAPPFQIGDLLFFGGAGEHRSISHVGISAGEWRIIHSSASRNGVYEDNVEAVNGLRDRFRGARTFIAD